MNGELGFSDRSPLSERGRRLAGRVSHQQRNFSVPEPQVNDVLDGIEVLEIEGGAGHTLVLSKSGYVYSFGRASEGQLGREVPMAALSASGAVDEDL